MTTAYTSLLGLALPVTGELSGTWGDIVNNSITNLLDSAVAGTTTISADADVTLTTTTGAANTAREAIILWTANGTTTRNITAPAQSKIYTVINASAGTQSIVLRGAGPTTGVTILKGEAALCAWNGSDFIKISNTAGSGTFTDLTVTGNTILGDASTDTVTVNGYMGVGGAAPSSDRALNVAPTALTGTSQYGASFQPTGTSSATSDVIGVIARGSTAASAFTATNSIGLYAINAVKGAGSTITNQHGVYVADQTQGTNNYGITSAVSSGTNKWNIYASGTASNYFAGNTIVEVTDNTNAALRITQLGTGNALLVEDSTNPDSTPFVIDASGRTLVGYTSNIGITDALLQVSDTTDKQAIFSRFSNNSSPSTLVFAKSLSGTLGTNTVLTNGDGIGIIQFRGADGTNYIQAASISAAVDGTPGAGDMPGRLVFSTTADGASSPTERVRIGSDGGVGIGAANTAGYNLLVSKNLTGSTNVIGIASHGSIQSDATSASMFRTSPTVSAAAFTLGNLNHFIANQSTIGAGATVTNQIGFKAEASLTGATNNYGFYGTIASGTGRYNFYANGTADNYFNGSTYIGGAATSYTQGGKTSAPLNLSASGATVGNILATQWSASGSASAYIGLGRSASGTTGTQGVISSGAAIGVIEFSGSDGTAFIPAAQIAGYADGTPGTNDMPGRLVFSTTADGASSPTERMRINNAGNVGIGSASIANVSLRLSKNVTGSATSYSFYNEPTVQSDVTTTAYANRTNFNTAAAAFTLSSMVHYGAQQGTIGVGSAVTTQYGFLADSGLTGATNNYGFNSQIAAGTGRYNFYAAGTADNYFAGNVGIGNTAPACALDVTGGIQTSRTAVTSPASTDGNVFSGTYTPTLTNTTNVAASTAYACQYMRVGNVVTVSGRVNIDPTAAGAIVLDVTFPIASTSTTAQNAGGTFFSSGSTSINGGGIYLASSKFRFSGVAVDTAARDYYFSATYQVI